MLPIGAGPSMNITQGDTLNSLSFMDGNFRMLLFRSFNRSGQLIDSIAYEWDTSVYTIAIRPYSLHRLDKETMVSTHDILYNNGNVDTYLFQLDKNLDTLRTIQVEMNGLSRTYSYDVLVEDSTVTVLGHYVLPNNKLHLYLAQFDTALNFKWYNTIADFRIQANQYYMGYYPGRLKRYGNSYYITGYCTYRNPTFVEDFLVKTDLQGNLVWDKRYQYQGKNSAGYDMLLFNDSIFRPSGFLSRISGQNEFIQWHFMYLDTAGSIIKDSLYSDEEINFQLESCTKTRDGNILMIGDYYWGGSKGVIWKMDKDLNTIWRRVYYYGQWEDESWLYNIGEWSDGGIISQGTYFDRYQNPTSKNGYLWHLSTDANGCLSANDCGSGIGVLEWALPGQGIKVYPNPATDYINIELSMPTLQNTSGTARLYNLSGQMVLQKGVQFENGAVKLDFSNHNLTNGQYVLEVKTESLLFTEKIVIE